MTPEEMRAKLIAQGLTPVAQQEPEQQQQQQPEAAPAEAPVASAEIEIEGDDEGFLESAGNVLKDMGLGIVGGVRDGAQELGETVQWAAEGIGNAVTRGHDVYYTENDGFEWLTKEEVLAREDVPEWQTKDLFGETISLPEVADNETVAGGVTRGVAQFLTGYGVFGKGVKTVKGAMAAGAATDFATFDAHEARLSDFLRENTGLQDPITEYLSVDMDDTVLEGKLKNALEGMGLGIATEGMVRLVKGFKKAKTVQAEQGDEAAAQVMNDTVEEMVDDGVTMDLFDEVSDPNLKDTATPGVRVDGQKAAKGEAPVGGPAESAGQVTSYNKAAAQGRAEAKAKPTPAKPVDTEGLQKLMDHEMALVRGGSQPDPNRTVTGSLFNFDKLDVDVNVKDVLNSASSVIKQSALKDRTTFEKIEKEAGRWLADSLDVGPEVIEGSLRRMAKQDDDRPALVIAGKQLINSLARESEDLATKISMGKGTDEDRNALVRLQSRLIETAGNLKSVITASAQTTTAGRIRTSDVVTGDELKHQDIMDQIMENLDSAGGRQKIDDLARAIVLNRETGGGAAGLMRISANRGPKGVLGVANEIRINGLLSSIRTQEINLASTLVNTALMPMERSIGGILTLDPSMIREGGRMYLGVARALKDSFKMAGAAFKAGRGIIDPEASILEANGADFRAIRSESENPLVRNLVNGLGTVVRLPSRGLLTGDELMKQINYRADLYARLHTQADDLVRSGQITRKDAAKFVSDRMESAFNKDGTAKGKASLEYAREATFTNALRKGSMPKGIQDMTNKHPALKVLLPFVRTPTNIVVAASQRTPGLRNIPAMSKTLRDDLASGDKARVAAAKGKLVTGSLLWGTAILAAQNGNITGGGPSDPVAKQRLLETGWRPYSLKVTQDDGSFKYVEYRRADPYAMFFGIAADIVEIGGMLEDGDRKNLAAAGLAAVANNLGSKTWLQGITDAAQAYSDGERYGERYLNSMAVSFMPFSSALRDTRKAADPVMRDTSGSPDAGFLELESMVNSFKNGLPGYSKSLPAKRSWITGKPVVYPPGLSGRDVTPLGEAQFSLKPMIDPTVVGERSGNDTVLEELSKLPSPISGPSKEINGVKMSPAQYERYQELHGSLRVGRYTMYERLENEINKESYDKDRVRYGDASDGELDRRTRIIRKVVSGYRKAAKAQLLKEYPELRSTIEDRMDQARRNNLSAFQGLVDLGD